MNHNHKDDCAGVDYRYSGSDYNRVRICQCGAEDHAPESGSLNGLFSLAKRITDKEDAQLATTERVRALAAELHANRDYTDPEMDFFELVEDILFFIKTKSNPEDVLKFWMRKHYSVERDNDGQTVIYLGDGEDN